MIQRLYLSLVLPLLTYCSVVWRPHLIKDILALENLHRRATRYIINDASLDYKECLSRLNMLPLMYLYEIADIMFTTSSIKNPSSHFNINDYISLSESNTRSSSNFRLKHRYTNNNKSRHSFFYRIPRLWNSLPPIDPTQSTYRIKLLVTSHLTDHFNSHFNPDCPCSFHYLCPCNSCYSYPINVH